MKFDDLARDAAHAVHDQVKRHPVPGVQRRTPVLHRLAPALGAAVIVIGAVLAVMGLFGGDRTNPIDEPPSTTVPGGTTTTSLPTRVATPDVAPGEWFRVPDDAGVFPAGLMESVTIHNGQMFAVGGVVDSDLFAAHPQVWRSGDGVNWERFDLSPGTTMLFDVASNGKVLVAVGYDSGAAAVWTSSDGIVWSRVDGDSNGFGASSGFDVAAEDVGRVPALTDRVDATLEGRIRMSAVTSWQGGFVAVGEEQRVELLDAAAGGFEEAEYGRASVWTSPDGLTWTRVDDASFGGLGFTFMRDVVTNGTSLVAVGQTSLSNTRFVPRAWFSEDGRSWQEAPIDDAWESADMTTVTSDGEFYYAAGNAMSSGSNAWVTWSGDGPSWEREGVIPADEIAGAPDAYLIEERGRFLVGEQSGSILFLEPSAGPFEAVWEEFLLQPPAAQPVFGDSLWVEDRLVLVGSTGGKTAVWQWVPPQAVVSPTVIPPDADGPVCSATERIEPDSQLWDDVAASLFEQWRAPLGLQDQNQPVYVEAVTDDGWVAVISWFDRADGDMTLWVGEPIEAGRSFTPVWSRFGTSTEEILGALEAAFPDAPPGLLCIDTESLRTQ